MMKRRLLGLGISAYQEAKGLERCLESTIDEVDVAFVVDGRYAGHKADNDLSTDGTREVALSFGRKVQLIDGGGLQQTEKRTLYMQACRRFGVDVLFIIDADEWVMGYPDTDWQEFKKNVEKMCIKPGPYRVLYNHAAFPGTISFPRIWVKPYEYEYYQRHFEFRHIPTGKIIRFPQSFGRKIIPGLTLTTDKAHRSTEFQKARDAYDNWQVNYEAAFPERHYGIPEKYKPYVKMISNNGK